MESPERYRYIIGTSDTIKEMLENQGWTVSGIDHKPDNPYCGSVTAGKGDIQAVTYYFEYHRLSDIEEQFKRIPCCMAVGCQGLRHPQESNLSTRIRVCANTPLGTALTTPV